ncbi:hypothetical protein D9758_004699 [Tetrapyrgos nigripes]|uniref:Branched-chain-amino-acid aminotransferase n=1 Tax=Tetrapyrgos nigripes TaxID=182062 RepID=A0A8H5LYM8_9AGAR|nr:hypothetical protein D9758_004699 [Tetrapyrgos nigripes]
MRMTTPATTPDPHNIQGDIIVGIPKKTQTYFFFQIDGDPSLFRKALVDIVPLIKTAAQVQKDREALREHKRRHGHGGDGPGPLLKMTGTQIAFSNAGLVKMGISGVATPSSSDPKSDPFVKGQFRDAQNIGDAGTGDADNFKPAWDPAFGNANIDGVIFVGGDSHHSVNEKMEEIKRILGPSVKEVISIIGDTRPKNESGHEHFGFLDGISNPTIEGLDKNPLPGPKPIAAKHLITGQTSDANTPPVIIDGSFLAFRYLFQLVPEFNEFLKSNPIKGKNLSDEEGSELLGARMVGRWKSGAPIDLTPNKDDPNLGNDSQRNHRNNNFFYTNELTVTMGDQTHCPFSAHTRKTNPRADFTEHGRGGDILDSHRIARRGIQFGPEVTQEEANNKRTIHGRGLLFVCYQSDILNGFQFVQKSWANNPDFLDLALDNKGNKLSPGLDSIIGQNAESGRDVVGTDPADPDGKITIPRFIVPRGGEYFFSPSITALRDIIALGYPLTRIFSSFPPPMAIQNGHAVNGTTNGAQLAPKLQELDPSKLKITLSEHLQPLPELSTLQFGEKHSDHILVASFDPKTGWSDPEIRPYGKIELDPMSSALQYGTNCFEGMKAYLSPTGTPLLFRPQRNMARLASSVHRLALPPFSPFALLTLIKKLVVIEKRWIPSESGYSLYVRPTVIGTRNHLGVKESDSALIYVMCSPTGPYFPLARGLGVPEGYIKPVNLLAVSSHVRAWPGGTGGHKLAVNYSPGFLPMTHAMKQGWDQILWLRGDTVMEVGAMNFFICVTRDDGDIDLITPPLDGTILPGVTRASIMEIARAHSASLSTSSTSGATLNGVASRLHVSETELSLSTLIQWSRQGKLIEAFGVGTAAILAPVGIIGFEGAESELPSTSAEPTLTEETTSTATNTTNGTHASGGIDPPSSLIDSKDKSISGVSGKELIREGGKITLPVHEKGIGPISDALRGRVLDIQEGRISFAGFSGDGKGEGEWSVTCV